MLTLEGRMDAGVSQLCEPSDSAVLM
jgi:hypothetical protein